MPPSYSGHKCEPFTGRLESFKAYNTGHPIYCLKCVHLLCILWSIGIPRPYLKNIPFLLMGDAGILSCAPGCIIRSRLTPNQGLDLFGGQGLLGGIPRPPSRHDVPDSTNLHWHTYGVSLKKQFWLVNTGECPQQYVPYNEIGITPQECSLLPRHPMSGNTMLWDTLSRCCFWRNITRGVR